MLLLFLYFLGLTQVFILFKKPWEKEVILPPRISLFYTIFSKSGISAIYKVVSYVANF